MKRPKKTLLSVARAAYEAYNEHDYRWATEAEQDRWMRVAARLETKYAKSIYVDLSARVANLAKSRDWSDADIARALRPTIDAWRAFKNGHGNAHMRARVRDLLGVK